ncbi:response regulator [Actinokineospora inagensis]|uniref:response regulator n=1 Tax=Actinokineospora inagensis TaxID=103730 RepID=UPI0003FEDD0E|nr:response regulator transcription factor [Actinokineospora inagensis]
MPITVLLADDHALFRSGLRAVLDTQPDLTCVGEAADGEAAVELAARLTPDVAVLDVRMPRLDGLAAVGPILANGHTRVLVLTTYDLDEYVYRGLQAGVSGFLLKSLPPEEMVSAIRVAARGDALIDPSVTKRLAARFTDSLRPAHAGPDRLTSREREVLLLVADALSNAEIAVRLNIGEETVKTHVSRVLAKLDLRDRVHAVVYAHRHGLVQGP